MDQPYLLHAENFDEAMQQMQDMLDDIYHNTLAGANVGDVFQINNQSGNLTLNTATNGGLEKTDGSLAVQVASGGALTLTSSGLDAYLVSTSRPGVIRALPNDATKFLDGSGHWSSPTAAGLTQNVQVTVPGVSGTATLHFTNGLLTEVTTP